MVTDSREPSLVLTCKSMQVRFFGPDESKHLVLQFVGMLNEEVSFSETLGAILRLGEVSWVVLDTAQLNRINSCGLREWILFLEKLQKSRPCRFVAVGEAMVEQAGMVPTALGRKGTLVDSFHSPYFCPNCQARTLALQSPADIKDSKPPRVGCMTCGTDMDFDSIPDEYFQFLKHLDSQGD